MKTFFKYSVIALAGLFSISTVSCKKSFLETKPTDQASTADVFTSIEGAEAALHGIHRTVYEAADDDLFGYPSIALMWDLMGEDMSLSNPGAGWFVGVYRIQDQRAPSSTASYMWGYFYRIINNANYILANIDKIEADQNRKDFVKAGAHFYRAWSLYNLVNCYMFTYKGSTQGFGEDDVPVPVPGSNGYTTVASFKDAAGVPMYTEPTTPTNLQGNPRASVEENYAQIIKDLDAAIDLYEGTVVNRSNKSEINIDVVKGVYARVAMMMQDWPKAEQMAREARASYPFMTANQTLDGFNSASNPEWMWGSIINTEQSGIYWSFLSQMDFDMNGYASLGQEKRINTELFNDNLDTSKHDIRRNWWISREQKRAGAPYAAYSQRKFRGQSTASFAGDFPMMRASEMALIEAEAMAQQGNAAGGAALLNQFVQTRQPTFDIGAPSALDLVKEIWIQRRIELWGEGFRYFDLQRSFAAFPIAGLQNTAGMVRTPGQGHSSGLASTMQVLPYAYTYLFRIPGSERETNPQVTQNP